MLPSPIWCRTAANASSIVVVHNHPSGNPLPSEADIAITAQLSDAAELIGINLDDHVIIGADGAYFSFKDADLLPVRSSAISASESRAAY